MGQMDMTQNIADKTMVSAPMPDANATIIGASVKCPVCGTENSPTEKYCGDCGFLLASTPGEVGEVAEVSPQPRLSASDREHLLKAGENTIGREGTDVLLEDQTVSRRHALVILEDGKCFVEDLGSTNGTSVNGAQLAKGKRVEVESGAELKFGSSRLTLDLPEMPAATDEAPAEEIAEETPDVEAEAEPVEIADEIAEVVEEAVEEETPAPVAVAQLIGEGIAFAVIPGANTIGRRGDNTIVLSGDPYVSVSHAQIAAEDGSFILTDVGSTNGTMLNGTKVEPNQPVTLTAGDEIVFGKTTVKLELV